MSSHKNGARSGADGNMRLLAQYGGHRSGRKAYADGGAVNPSLDEGLAASGDSDMKPSKDKGETKTARIHHFLHHPGFPVDIRHNAKIGREKLAVWAKSQLRGVAY